MTAHDNQVGAEGQNDEWEEDGRSRNGNACCTLLIDLVSFFTVEFHRDASFSGRVDIKALWTNEADEDALVDGSVVGLELQRTVVNARTLVKQQVSFASGASVSGSLATSAGLLADSTDTVESYLSRISTSAVTSAIEVKDEAWLAESALSDRIDASCASLVALVAPTRLIIVNLLVRLANWHASLGVGIKTHVVEALSADVGLSSAFLAVLGAGDALVSFAYTDADGTGISALPIKEVGNWARLVAGRAVPGILTAGRASGHAFTTLVHGRIIYITLTARVNALFTSEHIESGPST